MARNATGNTRLFTIVSAALLPILVFYALLFREMRNVPIIDDYQVILDFVLTLRRLPGLGHKLLWIVTAQHLEYKFPVMNTIVAAQWAITGKVNFLPIIVTGDLMVLGILWLFWQNCFAQEPNLTRRILLFLPIIFLFMQLNYAESVDWATANTDYVPAIFFSLAAFHFLLRDRAHRSLASFVAACVCSLLGYLCFPNAFLAAPIGLLLLLQQRRWKRSLAWCLSPMLAMAIFLFRHHSYPLAVAGVAPGLLRRLWFYISLTGGAAENMSHFPVKFAATVLGILLLATLTYSVRARFYRANPFACTAALWVLGTMAMITQWRTSAGIAESLAGRYKLYSDLLLIFSYVFAVHCLDTAATPLRRKRRLYAATLTLTICFAAGSDFFGYKFLAHRQAMVALGLNQYAADPATNVPMISMDGQPLPQTEPEQDRTILNEATRSGIYALPPPSQR